MNAARLRAWAASLLLPACLGCASAVQAQGQADGPACTRSTGLSDVDRAQWQRPNAGSLDQPGAGTLVFRARDGNDLALHYIHPEGFVAQNGPIWFVMHGQARDAGHYARQAAAAASRYRALVLVIEFPRQTYPTGDSYTLGIVSRGRVDEFAWSEGRWRDPRNYLYTELERVFEAVRASIGGKQPGYYVFGHSAGAQFTHRLVTFLPCARVLGAVAANAGWYTLPRRDAPNPIPYSLRATPLAEREVRAALAAPLTLLLGTHDTRTADEDDSVRGTAAAQAQGPNRLARGRHYYETGQRLAQQLGAPFNWKLALVPGAGHSAGQVIDAAAAILFETDGAVAKPSRPDSRSTTESVR